MKTLTIIILGFFTFACASRTQTVKNINQTTPTNTTVNTNISKPEEILTNNTFTIDPRAAEVKTLAEYTKFKTEASSRYNARKTAASKAYNEIKTKSSKEYWDFEKIELEKVRTSNKTAYLDWLDAKQMNNYEKQQLLEKTVPELQRYVAATDMKYTEHKKREDEAWDQYKKIDTNAWDTFKKEEDTAWKSFQAAKNNNAN